jgi:hypothetical protein
MGTDNLHHKRKAKQARDLARKKAKKAPYAKVLIVCEGEKTEPNYFFGLKDHLELNSANVVVTGECGSSPISIIKFAFQRYREERDAGDPFDKVFCVFDRDTHETYHQALEQIDSAKPKDTFRAITSVPCFEYWLLLHFEYTTTPIVGSGNKSAGDRVIDELRKYLPEYKKGNGSVFEQLIGQLDQAKAFADRSLKAVQVNGTDNPSTFVHELVEYLQSIKK